MAFTDREERHIRDALDALTDAIDYLSGALVHPDNPLMNPLQHREFNAYVESARKHIDAVRVHEKKEPTP
jgi:hypothetical protein